MVKTVKFVSSNSANSQAAKAKNTFPRSSLKFSGQTAVESLPDKSLIERIYGCEVNVDAVESQELVSAFLNAEEPLTMRYAVLNRAFDSGALNSASEELTTKVLSESLDQINFFIANFAKPVPGDGRVCKGISTMLITLQNLSTKLNSRSKLAPLVVPVLRILELRGNNSVELVKTSIGTVNMFMETSLLSKPQAVLALETLSQSSLRLTGCHGLLRRVDSAYKSLLEDCPEVWIPLAVKLLLLDEVSRQTGLQMITKHETIKSRAVLSSCLAMPYKPAQPECTFRVMLVLVLKKLTADQTTYNQSLQIWALLARSDAEPAQWLWFVEHCFNAVPENKAMLWTVIANNNIFEAVLAFIRLCANPKMPLNECMQFITEAAKIAPIQHAKDMIRAATLVCDARDANPAISAPFIAKLTMQFVQNGVGIDQFAFKDVLHTLKRLLCTAKSLTPQNRVFLRCVVERGLEIDPETLCKVYIETLKSSAFERKSPVFLSALVAADAQTLNLLVSKAFEVLNHAKNTELSPLVRPSYFSQIFTTNDQRELVLGQYFKLLTTTVNNTKVNSEEWALAASILMKTNIKSDYARAFLLCFDFATDNEQAWTQWQNCFNLVTEHLSEYLYTIKQALSWVGVRAILGLEGFDEVRARIIVMSLNESTVENLQSALPSSPKVWDECIRRLGAKWGSRGFETKSKLAVKLAGGARMRLLARYVLQRLALIRNGSTNDYTAVVAWNQEIAPALASLQQPIITLEQRETLISRIPGLAIPRAACAPASSSPPAPSSSTQMPPPQSKRRKMILTGTLPESTLTPPPSSQDAASESSIDIPSSPPADINSGSAGSGNSGNSFDPARMLKRTMLGLDIQDAARTMTRAEKTMIYNIMFRSCMWLKTHLAETRDQPVTEADVSAAKSRLEKSMDRLPEPQKLDLTKPIDGTCLDLALTELHK